MGRKVVKPELKGADFCFTLLKLSLGINNGFVVKIVADNERYKPQHHKPERDLAFE